MTTTNKITIFGEHEPNTLAQLEDVASRAERAALMADGHLGYVMPIGGVAAYREQGLRGRRRLRHRVRQCGDPHRSDARRISDLSACRRSPTRSRMSCRSASAGRTARTMRRSDHPLFDSPSWDAVPRTRAGRTAQQGARAARHRRQRQSLRRRVRRRNGRDLGRRALRQPRLRPHRRVRLPGDLAGGEVGRARAGARGAAAARHADGAGLLGADDAGRRVRLRRPRVGGAQGRVASSAARELELVHNHHNFAWREEHDGETVVVVRKGATPAFPGQKGFIGGSMGDDAVIVRGATAPGTPTEELQRDAMYSTVHGAGRVMSRTQAAGKRNWKTGKVRQARRGVAADDARTGCARRASCCAEAGSTRARTSTAGCPTSWRRRRARSRSSTRFGRSSW